MGALKMQPETENAGEELKDEPKDIRLDVIREPSLVNPSSGGQAIIDAMMIGDNASEKSDSDSDSDSSFSASNDKAMVSSKANFTNKEEREPS